MKTMKKLGVLALVLVMALSFAACSKDEGSSGNTPVPGSVTTQKTEVEKYVEENSGLLADSFEQGFAGGSGMECDTTVEGRGNDIIFTVCIGGFDGLSASDKATMQATFDSMNADLKEAFSGVVNEIPSIETLIIDICEEDGDKVANIVINY